MDGTLSAVIGIAVLVWVVVNQVRARPLSARRMRIAGILGVVGLVQLVGAAAAGPVPALGWVLLLAGLAIGALLGGIRAGTVRLWVRDGVVWTQGHAATAALWVVGIAAHVGLDLLARAVAPGSATIDGASVLLFVAVSLGVQGVVTARRAAVLTGDRPTVRV
ncbi:hypothetical protein GCM10023200_09320 [Actinomycetospora chlora]|uniref:DUF1453 domain-containing protein n=1 Tax=Actinomycetospora chlora TaxID=663608 RepID=A0ABP9AEF9_9PSEU